MFFLKYIKAAFLAALFAMALVSPSFALVTDPGVQNGQKIIPASVCSATQNVCYVRATINFNDNFIGGGAWAFTLPANAYLLAVDLDVTTAFNATTTNALTIGTTPTGTNFLASTSITSAGVQHMTTAAGLGVATTGVLANQNVINGGVQMFMRYTQTGTAATAGVVVVVITYAKNDDK